jgi:hypothetical protein
MEYLNLNISTNALNVNGVNMPIKTQMTRINFI